MAGIGAVNQIESQENSKDRAYKQKVVEGQKLEKTFGPWKFTEYTQFYIQAP